MTTKNIEKKAKEIRELTRQKEEIEAKITALQDQLKGELTARGAEEITAGEYRVRYKEVESTRFDTKSFRQRYEDLYNQFARPATSRRFSIV